jgi:hypothetical protein
MATVSGIGAVLDRILGMLEAHLNTGRTPLASATAVAGSPPCGVNDLLTRQRLGSLVQRALPRTVAGRRHGGAGSERQRWNVRGCGVDAGRTVAHRP